jgi:hypothetical protein
MKLQQRGNWNQRPVYTDLLQVDWTPNTRKQLTFDVIGALFALSAAFQTQTMFPVYRREDERDKSKSAADDNQTLNSAVPKQWYSENNIKIDAIELGRNVSSFTSSVRWQSLKKITNNKTKFWEELIANYPLIRRGLRRNRRVQQFL